MQGYLSKGEKWGAIVWRPAPLPLLLGDQIFLFLARGQIFSKFHATLCYRFSKSRGAGNADWTQGTGLHL